jgi:hypothetical protein
VSGVAEFGAWGKKIFEKVILSFKSFYDPRFIQFIQVSFTGNNWLLLMFKVCYFSDSSFVDDACSSLDQLRPITCMGLSLKVTHWFAGWQQEKRRKKKSKRPTLMLRACKTVTVNRSADGW